MCTVSVMIHIFLIYVYEVQTNRRWLFKEERVKSKSFSKVFPLLILLRHEAAPAEYRLWEAAVLV